ncbi:enhancer of filamentation 1-like isoform X3 [Coregonus clupeaformis]|uniref:enhancer of filamentation 1-like isoform X3 n=1 Tax=Coregonus clupeaformis TaxID=59861 RepID=UPI001E1C7AAA|nr:enhancer of filamentation 1-like isoform X3 [Coregonus clupeaformis]
MKYKNLMAKALYDNVPESPEELAFRKGDILTIIEQNTGGLEGWWLCSLHGRQGIAPGNRLKLLIGPMFDAQSPAAQSSPTQSSHTGSAYQQQGCMLSSQGLYQVPPSQSPGQQGIYQVPPGQDVYQVPPQRSALAADNTPSKVYSVPPCRNTPALQEGNYDFPQPLKQHNHQEGIYDVPPPALTKPSPFPSPQSNYDFPPSSEPIGPHHLQRPVASDNEGIYDVPPPAHQLSGAGPRGDLYDIPRGMQQPPSQHRSTPQERDRDRGKGQGVYDIPPALGDVTDGVNRLSISSTGSTRSSMSTSSTSTSTVSSAEGRLALNVDQAVQRLCRLQKAVEASVGALQTLASSSHWRTYPFMERHTNEVRTVLDRVRAALADFVVFGRGAVANATALSDPSLHSKLRRQLGRLEDSQQIILQTYQSLENCGWALNALATSSSTKHQIKSDNLDRFVMVSRTVPDDAKQLASSVGGNAELLFRRAPTMEGSSYPRGSTPEEAIIHPLTSPSSDSDNYGGQTKPFPVPSNQDKGNMNNSEKCVKSWMEDYDYVHLQGKEDFERQQKELLEKENIIKQSKVQLGQEQINQFKQLEQEVIKPVENDITQWISHQHPTGPSSSPSDSSSSPSPSLAGGGAQLCGRDRQLLGFYAEQCQLHFVTLLNAVDAFFGCVGAGQPPRIFVAHSKFVILSAHKLVFIGDTLSRQAATPEVANRVMNSSNVLCDLLKTVVGATKTAALHYPNTAAVQDMVDKVTDLSHHAQQFKEQLLQMAAL